MAGMGRAELGHALAIVRGGICTDCQLTFTAITAITARKETVLRRPRAI